VKQGGIDVERKTIAKFNVLGDTTIAGEKAWKIARQSTTALTGSGVSQGQAMTLQGTATGKATLLVSQKGVFVGSDNEDLADVKILLTTNGMEIGVTTTANTKIEKIKK